MNVFREWILEYPQIGRVIRKIRHPRSFQAFGVGAAKTGTTSIAGLFRGRFRAEHEPHVTALLAAYESFQKRHNSRYELQRFLERRDVNLWLEIESSHALVFVIEDLVKVFPKAKFILTVREPYSWLRSIIGQHMKNRAPIGTWKGTWKKLRDMLYIPERGLEYMPEEDILRQSELYPIAGYLEAWTKHNKRVICAVPRSKLLILRTEDISSQAERIADFLEISVSKLELSRSHLNKKRNSIGNHITSSIGKEYIENQVEEKCSSMKSTIEKKFGLDLSCTIS